MADFQPAVPYFPPLPAKTQEELLALFDRLLPAYYLEPLKSPGPGYEYLQSVAKMNARISEAVAHVGTGSFIGSATGGTYATATVEFYRDNSIFGAFTLKTGTVVGTADGFLYQTVEDVTFGATDLGPHTATVQALARGWNWNKPGPVTLESGATVPGSIDRIVAPVVPSDTNNFDPTVKVRQIVGDAVGGSAAMLDGLGVDRGIYRTVIPAKVLMQRSLPATYRVVLLAGTRLLTTNGYTFRTLSPVTFEAAKPGPEGTGVDVLGPIEVEAVPLLQESPTAAPIDYGDITSFDLIRWGTPNTDATVTVTQGDQYYSLERDDAYRTRIAILPNTVTPNALLRVVEQSIGALLAEMGLTWDSREIWDIRYQSAYSENGDLTNGPKDFPINTTLDTAELNAPVAPYSSNIFVYDSEGADALSNRYLYPETGMIVYALPNDPTLFAKYLGLVNNLEAAKAAGISLAFVEQE